MRSGTELEQNIESREANLPNAPVKKPLLLPHSGGERGCDPFKMTCGARGYGIPRSFPRAQWRLIQLWEMGLPSGPALSQLYVWTTAHAGFLRLSGRIVLGERGEEGRAGADRIIGIRTSSARTRDGVGESWARADEWTIGHCALRATRATSRAGWARARRIRTERVDLRKRQEGPKDGGRRLGGHAAG